MGLNLIVEAGSINVVLGGSPNEVYLYGKFEIAGVEKMRVKL